MKKLLVSCITLCALGLSAAAQEVPLKVTVKGADAAELGLYVKPANITGDAPTVQLTVEGNAASGNVSPSEEGFYTFYGKRGGGQLMLPFYITDSRKLRKMKLVFTDTGSIVDVDNNNRALSTFNNMLMERFRHYFRNEKDMSPEQRTAYIQHITFIADSIAKRHKVDDKVSEYLRIWAFTMEKNILRTSPQGIVKELDTPMSLYFRSSAPFIVMAALPQGTMNEQLEYLNQGYTCTPLKNHVAALVLDRFIATFVSTPTTYPQGLADVTAVVEKYGLAPQYIETFTTRKAPAKGKPFPTTATLQDKDGNAMDFTQFRGSYVYVDLWASWCGPCCKEVPHLQALEKELHGYPVVFLSISLDKSEDAWKQRMASLNCSGHQWISKDNVLSETFDVVGIPRFLLFDKEGNLIQEKATRPSDPQTKTLLQSLK